MAAVLVASLRPMPEGLPEIFNIDKVYHFVTYMVMAVLLSLALHGEGRGAERGRLSMAAIMAFAYGVMIEVFQSFTGTRSGDILDALTNGIGAAAGAYATGYYMRRKGARGGVDHAS